VSDHDDSNDTVLVHQVLTKCDASIESTDSQSS